MSKSFRLQTVTTTKHANAITVGNTTLIYRPTTQSLTTDEDRTVEAIINEKIRQLLTTNPNADLSKLADELHIQVVHVESKPKKASEGDEHPRVYKIPEILEPQNIPRTSVRSKHVYTRLGRRQYGKSTFMQTLRVSSTSSTELVSV